LLRPSAPTHDSLIRIARLLRVEAFHVRLPFRSKATRNLAAQTLKALVSDALKGVEG
jgi:hypothetical protein